MSEQKKTRILLVDDSVSMREMVGYTLKGAGYEVSQAEDGVVALKFAQGNTVDLVITDINMPNMDGVTFIRELKKLAQYVRTPVCVLTTETEQGKLEAEMHSLKDVWITKPVQPAHVLNIVGELLAD